METIKTVVKKKTKATSLAKVESLKVKKKYELSVSIGGSVYCMELLERNPTENDVIQSMEKAIKSWRRKQV